MEAIIGMPGWAHRIAELMSEKQVGTAELARAVGIKSSSVSNWLGKGKQTKEITGENLVAVAEYFAVTPAWIIRGGDREASQPARIDPGKLATAIEIVLSGFNKAGAAAATPRMLARMSASIYSHDLHGDHRKVAESIVAAMAANVES